jgi:putative ABC transport system permease protein
MRLIRLAWRNVWRNSRRTLIAVVAISLGLALLLLLDGLIASSKQAIYGNAVRLQGGNVKVHAQGYREKAKRNPLLGIEDDHAIIDAARSLPTVQTVSRRINTSGMLSNRAGTFPVAIIGLEPTAEAPTSLVAENITVGRFLQDADEDVVVIGQTLADRMEVGVGDRITLVGRTVHEQMRQRTVTITGIYDLGMSEIEKAMAFISLLEAQTLFELRDQPTEIVITLDQVGQEEPVVQALSAALPGYEVDSWLDLNPEMRQGIQANEMFTEIFGLIVLLIAGVGILNLLLMAVFERTREIGLLGSMGMKSRQVMALFLLEGILVGLIGALAGIFIGGTLLGYLGQTGVNFTAALEVSDMGALMGTVLYPRVTLEMLVVRGTTVAVIAALASLYPAWQASRREPAESLHFV